MVVLGVILCDLGLLLVLEVPSQIGELNFLAPVLGINEPVLEVNLCLVVQRVYAATYIFSDNETSNLRARRNRSYKAR